MSQHPFPVQELWDSIAAKIRYTDSCWLIDRGLHSNGYYLIRKRLDGKPYRMLAHRISYAHHFGPIPIGLLVCHKCDVRNCVNPEHLYAGTYSDNAVDREARERRFKYGVRRGEAHPKSKLTDDSVRYFKAARASGKSTRAIARDLGVSPKCLIQVAQGVTWRHVA
jgi:hypothetical protein